jgi:hypothetical protein
MQAEAPDAGTAAALRRDVTIVISPKDRFSTTQDHLQKVRGYAPGVPIIHVLCGPMPRQTREFLERQAGLDPDLELLDTGAAFANPYNLRNLALAQVRSKYVMFLFNDVEPLNAGWLAALHRSAEAHPEADVFQPFIWEGAEAPHATWIDLRFLRHDGELLCIHPNGPADVPADPSALPEKEQPYFVEDHAFFARTGFLKAQSILDPGAAYTREFLDMALTMRFRGARTRSVPSSQVLYAVPYEMRPGDLLYFCHRRSWSVSRGSVEYLQRKWGFRYWDDAYSRAFIDLQLASAAWTGKDIPATRLEQVEMMLGVFTAAGYDCFEVLRDGAATGKELTSLPAAHGRLVEALRNDANRVDWEMRHVNAVGLLPDFAKDFDARRRALREGKLFPVFTDARMSAAMEAAGPGRRPAPFAMLEISGIQGAEPEVIAALNPHACLLLRERGENGRPVFRAWLHAWAPLADEFALLEKCVRDGVRLAGRRLEGASARLHRSHDRGLHAVRVSADPAATGWRLLHCAWRPTALAALVGLLR